MRIALSNSRLEKKDCLHLFNEVVNKKVGVPPNEFGMAGGIFHDAASRFLSALQTNESRDRIPLMEAVFDEAWGSARKEEFAALPEHHYEDLHGLALRFAAREPFSAKTFAGTEVRLAVNEDWKRVDWFAKDAFYRMIFDKVEAEGSRVRITDYKTSWRADGEDEVLRNPQFRGYAAGVNAILPEAKDIEIVVDFVRTGIQRRVEVPFEDIPRTRDRIMRESNRLERAKDSGNWPAQPGEQCRFCPGPVYMACPLRAAATEYRPPQDESDAKAMLAEVELRRRQLREMDGRLRGWVEAHGPIATAGIAAAFAKVETVTYPGGPTLDVLRELDFTFPGEFIKGDRKALEKAAKKNVDLAAALLTIRQVAAASKWKIGKSDDEESL